VGAFMMGADLSGADLIGAALTRAETALSKGLRIDAPEDEQESEASCYCST